MTIVALWIAIMSFFFPTAEAVGEGCEHYAHLFEAHDMPVDKSLHICWRESRGFVDAVNY